MLAIGQTVAVSLEAVNGLGRDSSSLSSSQLISFQKVRLSRDSPRNNTNYLYTNTVLQQEAYAADFLYIGALCLTKVSLCLYLDTLTPKRRQKLTSVTIGGFTCLWALSAIFVHAFQCKLPHPWGFLDEKCINLVAFWTYFAVLNILTDIGLIVLPFMILRGIQVERRKKIVILACFASRILYVPLPPKTDTSPTESTKSNPPPSLQHNRSNPPPNLLPQPRLPPQPLPMERLQPPLHALPPNPPLPNRPIPLPNHSLHPLPQALPRSPRNRHDPRRWRGYHALLWLLPPKLRLKTK